MNVNKIVKECVEIYKYKLNSMKSIKFKHGVGLGYEHIFSLLLLINF